MSPTATLTLPQGADCSILVSGIIDGAGFSLNVTGWSVRAQARPTPEDTVLLAEWVTGTPTGLQGQATAAGSTVTLTVPGAMSDAWTWESAVLHIRITEVASPFRRERFGVRLVLDRSAVHT